MVIAALVIIAIVSILIFISLEDHNDKEKARESYSGDYTDYYEPWWMGIPIGSAGVYLNEDMNLTYPGVSGPLAIYQHRPPELETRSEAELYLAGFGYDVTGFRYKAFESPTGHSFSKGGCYIGLVIRSLGAASGNPTSQGRRP